MTKSVITESSTQPTQSGEGVALYDLTGNSPSQPMSTRNQELRKKRTKKLVELASKCALLESKLALIKLIR